MKMKTMMMKAEKTMMMRMIVIKKNKEKMMK
jgi:hypothetical protein